MSVLHRVICMASYVKFYLCVCVGGVLGYDKQPQLCCWHRSVPPQKDVSKVLSGGQLYLVVSYTSISRFWSRQLPSFNIPGLGLTSVSMLCKRERHKNLVQPWAVKTTKTTVCMYLANCLHLLQSLLVLCRD